MSAVCCLRDIFMSELQLSDFDAVQRQSCSQLHLTLLNYTSQYVDFTTLMLAFPAA